MENLPEESSSGEETRSPFQRAGREGGAPEEASLETDSPEADAFEADASGADYSEAERIEALRRYEVLDTPPEEDFDRITRLAAGHFDVPVSLVSLVDAGRQWFKSCYGFDQRETSLSVSFCTYAIQSEQVLVVENAAEDPRFSGNPLVTGEAHVRFYAGAPLVTPDGFRIGTLCVLDSQPRSFGAEERGALEDLAGAVIAALELRRRAAASRRREQALRESEERYRSVIENARDVIFQTDAAGRWTLLSPSWKEVMGYTVEESLGTSFMAYVHPEDREEELSSFRALAEGSKEAARRGVRYVREDGQVRWMRLAARVVTDEAGRVAGTAGTFSDVTDTLDVDAERDARKSAEKLLEAKTAFLNNVSHELRTPLASILGFAEVLAEEGEGEQRAFAEHIARSGERLRSTLNSVLSLARLEGESAAADLDTAPTDVPAAVQKAAAAHRPAAEEKGLAFEVTTPAAAHDLRASLNEGALHRILDNLIGNAIKFTDEGRVAVRVEAGTQAVRICVEDTGIGMGAEFQEKLFEDFQQEEPAGFGSSEGSSARESGAGLGLSIARRLTELMGGTIAVESARGEGTTFTVSFPRLVLPEATPAPPAEEKETPADFGSGEGGGEGSGEGGSRDSGEAASQQQQAPPEATRLLVVEDNPNTRALARHLLRRRYEVACAAGAEEALAQVEEAQQEGGPPQGNGSSSGAAFAAFLIDVNLGGGKDGVDLLRHLREAGAGAPALAFTAHAMPGDEERLLKAGFDGYVAKPFSKKELLEVVEGVLLPEER